jgi:hypothetical protein
LLLVIDDVNRIPTVKIAVYIMLSCKCVDGFDVIVLETCNLDCGFGAEGIGVIVKGTVGSCFCVATYLP